MSTTTIRLPEALKARVAAAAERAGTTSHGFILDAIAEKAEREELQAAFNDVADQRFAEIVETGKSVPWSDMRRYFEERGAGKKVRRPVAKRLVR